MVLSIINHISIPLLQITLRIFSHNNGLNSAISVEMLKIWRCFLSSLLGSTLRGQYFKMAKIYVREDRNENMQHIYIYEFIEMYNSRGDHILDDLRHFNGR